MTVQEAVDRVDALAPNQYSAEQKLRWLSDLDGKILLELSGPREARGVVPCAFESYTEGEEELLVPAPFAGDVYENYLLSRIAQANAEIQKYNLYAALFNTAYQQFASWFLRSRRPSRAEGWCLTCRSFRL